MSTETITGTVEQIGLESGSFERSAGHARYVPKVVRATILLDDGSRAYVQTAVGEMAHYAAGVMGPAGAEHYHSNPTDSAAASATDGSWPWAIESGVTIALPTKGSPFEGSVAYPYSRPMLTVWVGDRVTVRGSVEARTSKHDVSYVIVRRARVVKLERPSESQTRAA